MSNVTGTVRAKIVTATTPTIYNLTMPSSGTEYSQLLSESTKKILIRMRVRAKCKFAFVSGETATKYITIEPGCVYSEENLDLSSTTIYLQSEASGQTAEILEWT